MSGTGSSLSALADRVEPVPDSILPHALRQSSASVGLFKEEFRAAQRLRSSESVFIPEVRATPREWGWPGCGPGGGRCPKPDVASVLRTTHPPDLPPQGVAAAPAPSYVMQAAARPPTGKKSMGPGALARPSPSKSSRSSDPIPIPPCSMRPTSALDMGLHARVATAHVANGSATAGLDVPPTTISSHAGNSKAGLRSPSPGARAAAAASAALAAAAAVHADPSAGGPSASHLGSSSTKLPRIPSPGTYTADGPSGPGPSSTALTAAAAASASNRRAGRPFSAAPSDATGFIQEVGDEERFANETSRPISAYPTHSRPANGRAPAQAAAGRGAGGAGGASSGPASALRPWTSKRTGLVETTSDQATAGAVQHLRAASASLRKYSLPSSNTAISGVATTYARKPRAPYTSDINTPTPSERIANNMSPLARGLSPRTLEILSPGGISPTALGPLPHPTWQEVDDAEVHDGVPEADGVHTAARKHMSYMPLELFDNVEYDLHAPEEWVQLGALAGGAPAETVMYNVASDSYLWTECRVVGWDAVERMYIISFNSAANTGLKTKKVKRLNLRFKAEDMALFERRVAEAKEAREEAEEQLRLFFYIDSLVSVEVLHTYNYSAALHRAAGQVRGLSQATLGRLAPDLLDDLTDYFERAVKQAVLEYRRMDPLEEGRLKVLRIPSRRLKPPAPQYGLLPLVPSGSDELPVAYGDVQNWSRAHMFIAIPQLHQVLVTLADLAVNVGDQLLWCMAPLSDAFKAIGGNDFSISDAGVLPFPLRKFEALQHAHQRRVLKFVEKKMITAISLLRRNGVLATLLNDGKPYEDNDPLSEAHRGLLQRIGLQMSAAAHSLLQASARNYADTLESYQKYEGSVATASNVAAPYGTMREMFASGAFLTLQLLFDSIDPEPLPEEPATLQAEESGDADERERPGEVAAPAEIRKGSFRIRLSPSAEEITDVAAGMFVDMVQDLGQVPNIFTSSRAADTGIVEFADFDIDQSGSDTKPLCDPDALAKDPDISSAHTRVRTAVALALERAEEVSVLFEAAAEALAVDIPSIVRQLEPLTTPLGSYHKWIGAFRAAAGAAFIAAPTQVFTGLLLVDTWPLKQALMAKAEAGERALLEQLHAKTVDVARRVCARCEELSVQALVVSTGVRSVLDLKARLVATETEVREMMKWLAASRERDALCFAYRHAMADTDVELATAAQAWPKRMFDILERGWWKVEEEDRAFQSKLRASRDRMAMDLSDLNLEVQVFKDINTFGDMSELAHQGESLLERIRLLTETAGSINEDEGLLTWPISEWPAIHELAEELEPFASLYSITNKFAMRREDWLYGPVKDLNAEEVESNVGEWFKKMVRLSKGLPRPELRALAEETRVKLDDFQEHVPIILALCNPGMRGRHWERLSTALGTPTMPGTDGELNLQKLLSVGIAAHIDLLQELSDTASREMSLERSLDRMVAEWSGIKFELVPWKNTGGMILKGSSVEDAQMLLDDHAVKAQAMQSSPAAAPFLQRIEGWVAKLASMQDIIDAWMFAQQKWMFLGPVYGEEEIAKQMPKERYEFSAADTRFRSVMRAVDRNPEVLAFTDTQGLLGDLQSCNGSFGVIERSLAAYLESKKMLFPRFFFLSNDELIEVLSEAKEPAHVQPFAKKIFEAVSEFEFNSEQEITALISVEDERVPLDRPVVTKSELTPGVEFWLLHVEEQMRLSLATITGHSIKAYPTSQRSRWMLQWPGQVVLAVAQTYWTKGVVDALVTGGHYGLAQYGEQCGQELLEEVMLVRGHLNPLERATLGALVVLDVHARDVVAEMVADKVANADDFSWQCRLRYYWENNALTVRMLNAECIYGYEYLGNSSRLVITPLTDRCYRTLLGAHHMTLGGAPAGPAGTGKTETTKDLAKAVAIQCVVFNCSDGLDYLAMGRFFKGLAASGAWACFDEFNRIELEVLSVVAQQVLTIQRAKAAGKKRFLFEGTDMILVSTCNVFITMNPGYAGRSELPDNLKALFRDVAMMVPDYALISEIILYSYGYLEARSMAQKLVQTYRLCSEQLSRQDHYDYGMRAVMAVLRAAGNLKQRNAGRNADSDMNSEPVLMLRAITDVNLPKFLDEDVPLFKGILSDLFPGIVLPAMNYDDLTAALESSAKAMNLQPLPSFIEKAIQLYEMLVIRHGLMLVGRSFSMKTMAIRVLAAALGDMCSSGKGEHKVKMTTINPKAVTLGQLYGQDDPLSKEWTDGVLAVGFRSAARDTSTDRKWVILDGPVDAMWIENMNTVLDDNKKLCLNSGEIIAMQGLMNMIFEVQDLAVASPATVSRCGMVYMQPSLLGWRPIVASWMSTLPEIVTPAMRSHLNKLLEWLVPPCLRLVAKDCVQPVPCQDINLITSFTRLMQAVLLPYLEPLLQPLVRPGAAPASPPATRDPGALLVGVECLFLFSLVWSLGATVDSAGRVSFSEHLHSFLRGEYGPYGNYVAGDACPVHKPMPSSGSVYDWVYDKATDSWQEWTQTRKAQPIKPDVDYSTIIVTTADVVRYSHILQLQVSNHVPLLLVGPTGTGKSVYVKSFLAEKLDRSKWTHMDIIDGKLDKRRKGVFGPPVGKRCAVFVDDLNMPQLDRYGAQPPIELLRQAMDHGGWYDRHDNSFRKLVDLQVLAAMGPPGGGRNPVSNRYLRHFHVLYATEFDSASLTQIFSALTDWWFSRCKYREEVVVLRDKLVAASLQLHANVAAHLLPTPAKTHYVFNLRDLSKLFQGMSFIGEALNNDSELLQRLWVHEALRVYHDRLVDDTDRDWISEQIRHQVEHHFGSRFDVLMSRLADGTDEGTTPRVGAANLRRLLFADFMASGNEPRCYAEVTDFQRLTLVVGEYLSDLNAGSKKPLSLVLFQFCLEHVCRVARTIRQPGGHALLVGVGGSGRQSVTQLAAFIEGLQLFSIEVSSGYGLPNWHDDLKAAMRTAGEKNKNAIFMFSDSQVLDETMVEELSSLLNTGEVPNLFDAGELITIGESIRQRARAVHMDGSRADLLNFFIQQVRQNLRVVLCFSPVGDAFRDRLRRFPSLITCTTIDWYTVWPNDALASVAQQALSELHLDAELRHQLSAQCVHFHLTARTLTNRYLKEAKRHYYVTPTSYLQLLECFKSLLRRQQEAVTMQRRRYEVGLEKLAATEEQVLTMRKELEELQPQLITSGKETAELIALVELQTAEADKVKTLVEAEEAKAKEEADKVKMIKQECESDLTQAMPAYNAAIKALNTLTKNDISEVKGMKAPPMPVRLVMQAVCMLKGLQPTKVKDTNTGKFVMDWWESSKRMLGDMGFLDSLMTFDKDNIPAEIIQALQPLLLHPDFQPAKIKKVSQAAFGLCSWVRAMDTYDRVAKVVAPKRKALKEAQQQLAVVMADLSAKQAELKEVADRLAGLEAQLDAAKQRKAELEADVNLCEEKLDRATKLMAGLGGEKVRWSHKVEELNEQYVRLIGDMLLSAGVIAYLGAFSAEFRAQAVDGWLARSASSGIPCSQHFTLLGSLGNPVSMRQWAIWGLPKDDGQANKWIKAMEGRHLLVLKPATDPNYLRSLAAALPVGTPVLLEGLGERLDASLEAVLLKQTFKSAGVQCIKLGDQVVEWGSGFRLYMTTNLRNPHYPPEVCTRVVLLNFCITPAGLEDQLLGIVVAKERPELEEEKNRLIITGAESARKLVEIEDQILAVLSSNQGSILDDGEAVSVLQAAKQLSDEIASKQHDAAKTEQAIDKARTAYQPIAKHASVLYFCVAELLNIDPMYAFSLNYFIQLFLRSIEDSPRHPAVPRRLALLQEHFTFFLYANVCRALFEKDKLLFALTLVASIQVAAGKLAPEQVRFMVTGALSMDNPHPNPSPAWLSAQAWSHLCELEDVADTFAGLRESIAVHNIDWYAVYESPIPHEQERMDAFQRVLLLRCLTPDKLVPAVASYVAESMGARYIEPHDFKLSSIFADSSCSVPIIFVLSPGSDPMADLLAFADDKRKQVEAVSLGQGQGPIAERYISQGIRDGTWVVLQNCHLAKSFLPRLELLCEQQLAARDVNPEFRLWLTSYPSDIFPPSILENGLKITNEPPKGLRAGMERIYKSEPIADKAFFQGPQSQPDAFRHLVYALAFFHCVVVGRRNYGPVGWNIPYAFNENDLRISLRQLRLFLEESDVPPLRMLVYTAGECNYGGKVTDAKDRRTLMTLLQVYYREEVALGDAKLTQSGSYMIPEVGDYSHYLSMLTQLPLGEAPPEVFGLHPNATITRDLAEARQLLDGLALTTTSLTASGLSEEAGPDRNAGQAQSAPGFGECSCCRFTLFGTIRPTAGHDLLPCGLCLAAGARHQGTSSGGADVNINSHGGGALRSISSEISAKLPADFDLDAASRKYPVTYLDSMNTVLVQELGRVNVLLQVIRTSLEELARALSGEVVMSGELEQVAHGLSAGKVPELWLAKSFPSLKPLGPYVKELLERIQFFTLWLKDEPPVLYWISGFFFTQAFLTGAKQNYARKHRIPIDLIEFQHIVCDGPDDTNSMPEDGVLCSGMFLEAAGWDPIGHCLHESQPRVLFVQLPPVHFLPAKVGEESPLQVGNDTFTYTCPLYKTSERRGILSTTGHSTNFVCDVSLPSAQAESHWIMRGVALLTSLDS
ncbi:Dynein heavy chain 7, axonemal [Tetrabaena socialis]|uniref:Dynein heavy chain 7, axonemal n=1 Tax=Tetrabaena socialis TaxID=47790 RepID=A0A2J7ZXW1_9CHLO|nr:Dynein heavy chain 7, axonemal [Tetrabaena socialis]|eukprot:PNH05107.1 Dynein heavy chain 7, axonemal [Tetrabaena socialis]